MDNYKPVNTPGVPNSLPAGTVKGFLGERPRFSRGRCIGCGKLTYWSEDYTDPRGPLGLKVYAPFVAKEYNMHGPDVVACWGCGQNDATIYQDTLAKARKFWTPIYSIALIAELDEQAGGFYFSRKTLKFFGQTRKDFHLYRKDGRVFVEAPSYWGGKLMGISASEFKPATGRMVAVLSDDDKRKYCKLWRAQEECEKENAAARS